MTDRARDRGAHIDLVCVDREHLRLGNGVPDGHGTITVEGASWAYCSAGLVNAPHEWKATGGVPFDSICHVELATQWAER